MVVAATSGGGELMSVLAENATARLSGRLQTIPEKLRAISGLVDRDRYPRVVHALRLRRFSMLHLMVLVAVVAVMLGVLRVWQDRAYCQQKAAFHEDMAAFHRGRWPSNMNRTDAARLLAVTRRRPELAVLHSRMREKWQEAAALPWLAVEPDPPWLSKRPLK
jgi:hypothetical protein